MARDRNLLNMKPIDTELLVINERTHMLGKDPLGNTYIYYYKGQEKERFLSKDKLYELIIKKLNGDNSEKLKLAIENQPAYIKYQELKKHYGE